MKTLDVSGKVPTKVPSSKAAETPVSVDKAMAKKPVARERRVMPKKSKVPEPRSFRFTSRDDERFEAFRKLLEEEGVGDANLTNAKVMRALLLLAQIAPKALLKRVAEMLT